MLVFHRQYTRFTTSVHPISDFRVTDCVVQLSVSNSFRLVVVIESMFDSISLIETPDGTGRNYMQKLTHTYTHITC